METIKDLEESKLTFWVKAGSTTLFIIYWTLLVFYPLQPSFFWLQIIGSAGWVWAGIKWKEPTVIAMHGFVLLMAMKSMFMY